MFFSANAASRAASLLLFRFAPFPRPAVALLVMTVAGTQALYWLFTAYPPIHHAHLARRSDLHYLSRPLVPLSDLSPNCS